MEPIVRKNFSLFLLVITTMVVIVLKPSCCGASGTISPKSVNATATPSMICERPMEECLIARLDDELEFQMPSEISRRTLFPYNEDKQAQKAIMFPNKQAFCGQDGRYRPCAPNKNQVRKKETCDNFKRSGCI